MASIKTSIKTTVRDSSRLRFGSQAWHAHWRRQIERYVAGERTELLPLEAVR